jgi:hypothetical protein
MHTESHAVNVPDLSKIAIGGDTEKNEKAIIESKLSANVWSDIYEKYSKNASVQVSQVDLDAQKIKSLGFPEITGFNDEAPVKDPGFFHPLTHIFSKDKTFDQQIRETIERKYEKNPQFVRESEAEVKYEADMRRFRNEPMGANWTMPKAPDCPLHRQMNQEVDTVERQISRQVLSNMSPSDRQRLLADDQKYKADYDRAHPHMPTTFIGIVQNGPEPTPTNAMKDYKDRIDAATTAWVEANGGVQA